LQVFERSVRARQDVDGVLEGNGSDARQPTTDFYSHVGGIWRDLVKE
jgi:hypothetical protein